MLGGVATGGVYTGAPQLRDPPEEVGITPEGAPETELEKSPSGPKIDDREGPTTEVISGVAAVRASSNPNKSAKEAACAVEANAKNTSAICAIFRMKNPFFHVLFRLNGSKIQLAAFASTFDLSGMVTSTYHIFNRFFVFILLQILTPESAMSVPLENAFAGVRFHA